MKKVQGQPQGDAAPPSAPEALLGTAPVTRQERVWGFVDFSWVMIGLAVATWAFLIGGEVVEFLGLRAGIAAMTFGNVIGVGVVLVSVLGNTKYGLEHFSLVRSSFGRHGVKPLIYIVNFLVAVGWSGILAVMFGRAGVHIVNALAGTSFHGDHLLVSLFGLGALAAAWIATARGPITLRRLNRLAAPGLALVVVAMLILLLRDRGWSDLLTLQPLEPVEDRHLNFMLVVEFSIAAGLSWWPALGNLSRLATTQRSAVWAGIVGLLVVTLLAQTVGLMAALAYGSADPTTWMIPLAGAGAGILILLWVGFANVTTMAVQAYQVGVALRQESVPWLSTMGWPLLVGLFLGLSSLFLIQPSAVYDNFFRFLYWISLSYAPVVGVVLADYFVLRRQRLDLPAIFNGEEGSPYDFWRGWNLAAYLAIAVGVGVYLWLLNPVSLRYGDAFPYLTASVPSLLAAGAAHLVLTTLWVRRSRRGGYDSSPSPGPEEVS